MRNKKSPFNTDFFFWQGVTRLMNEMNNLMVLLYTMSTGSRELYNNWWATPTDYHTKNKKSVINGFFLAGVVGLEPTTYGFGDRYSTIEPHP